MTIALLIKKFFLGVTGFFFYFRNIEDNKQTRRSYVIPDPLIRQFLMIPFRNQKQGINYLEKEKAVNTVLEGIT